MFDGVLEKRLSFIDMIMEVGLSVIYGIFSLQIAIMTHNFSQFYTIERHKMWVPRNIKTISNPYAANGHKNTGCWTLAS